MIPQARRRQRWRTGMVWFLLAAFCLFSSTALAQFKRRSKGAAIEEEAGELPKPQLLNADTHPTLRYPVANFSGWSIWSTSYGWFDVTAEGIRYTPVQPKGKLGEGFEESHSEISEAKLEHGYLQFRTSNKKRMVFYLPEERWGSIHSGPGAMGAAGRGALGTASILRTMKSFDSVLAAVKPAPPPAPEVTLSANPSSVERGHAVTLVWTSQNATSLSLEPGVGTVEPAGSRTVTPNDSTTYTLAAQGPGGSKSATAQVSVTLPSPPTIVLIEPTIGSSGQIIEIKDATLKIRGVAMDNSGIPVVTINTAPTNMRPQNAQAAEFWSDPLTLREGENKFEIIATNRAQGQAKLMFVAKYSPPPPPPPTPVANPKALTKQSILDLLTNYVPSARVEELVRQNGLKFTPSQDDLKEIRSAGGQDALIDAILQAAGPKSSP